MSKAPIKPATGAKTVKTTDHYGAIVLNCMDKRLVGHIDAFIQREYGLTVGDPKEYLIALSFNGPASPAQLIEGKELDLLDAVGGPLPALRDLDEPASAALFAFAAPVFFFGFARFIAYNQPPPLPAVAVS